MATVDPKATLLGLIELQRLDSETFRLRRRIVEGPQLLERRSDRLKQADARLAVVHAAELEQKKQIGLHELEIKTRDTEIAKIQGAQGQSRTNEEFRAFGDHIGRLRKENRAVEDKILECMARLEALGQESAELKKARDALAAESAENAEQWKKDEAEYRAELDAAQAKRAEFARSLPPGPASTYERVMRGRDDRAVVPSEGKMCGGCQMAITPNDLARLLRMAEFVTCRSCGRILYPPELAKAAAHPAS